PAEEYQLAAQHGGPETPIGEKVQDPLRRCAGLAALPLPGDGGDRHGKAGPGPTLREPAPADVQPVRRPAVRAGPGGGAARLAAPGPSLSDQQEGLLGQRAARDRERREPHAPAAPRPEVAGPSPGVHATAPARPGGNRRPVPPEPDNEPGLPRPAGPNEL